MKKVHRCLLTISVLLLMAGLIILLLMWKYTDNTGLVLTTYPITNSKIPKEFHGFRIAQIADLHNTEFGEGNSTLLELLRDSAPDIIVFTGDQVDTRRKNIDIVLDFVKEAVQIAPCYLVTGNHEGNIVEIAQLNTELLSAGVILMENHTLELQRNNAKLTLIGLADPTMDRRFLTIGPERSIDDTLTYLTWDEESYSILLAHHPEYLDIYSNHNVDLVLSGHAHGGQIRIGSSGIIAPNQGLFPEYDAGRYELKNTTMVLSRGLGNSLFPWRINNPPELVIIELTAG